jgi:hypothetical protein
MVQCRSPELLLQNLPGDIIDRAFDTRIFRQGFPCHLN